MRESLKKARQNAWLLQGVAVPAFGYISLLAAKSLRCKLNLILLSENNQLEQAVEDLNFFASLPNSDQTAVLPFPEDQKGGSGGLEPQLDRLSALTVLANNSPDTRLTIVTTLRALAQSTPAKQALRDSEIQLKPGVTCSFSDLIKRLNNLGYDHESEVEGPGQFAVRGGIIDIYPANALLPYRLDFFGDELEEIRTFEPNTQRSSLKVESLTIAAPPGKQLEESSSGFLEYLPESVLWEFWDPSRIEELSPGFFSNRSDELTLAKLLKQRESKRDKWIGFSELDDGGIFFNEEVKHDSVDSETLEHYRPLAASEAMRMDRFYQEQEERLRFFDRIQSWQKEGYKIVLSVQTQGEKDRLEEFLKEHPAFKAFASDITIGTLAQGFRLKISNTIKEVLGRKEKDHGIVLVSDSEIFARYRRRMPTGQNRLQSNKQQVDQLLDFSELVEGDFLVHILNGICIYHGLTKLGPQSGFMEVISLEFEDGIILHLPLNESHLISRYVGLKKFRPALGKVGSNRWEKTRRQAEEATLDLAARLLKNQAERDSEKGHAFPTDSNWQREFEAAFPYKETKDQLLAIEASKKDMEKTQPMDRLICGDVGFGKTEVAIRAAFKAVLDGKQVAILGPTTVLTQQHFQTFRERMASFPVTVEMLNRFRTKAEQTKILQDLAAGNIDIIIGTHRLISKDVGFKDLGLLVIDEEHRFGVKHKEKLKELRLNVDVLSLSATPIPRTLHLALMGARDLSVIETAPINRRPIQTIIQQYDPKTVCEAIRKEKARGGQVFYLHNRVQTIDFVAARLEELMPEVSFVVAHGQMSEGVLERVMNRFVEGKYDVLISTTIIESGLDIPNANTIIIEAADRFGLSQLYQIRGRVGRFNRQAYAYLLLHRHARVLDMARKRLAALKQYNQLGAGFRIAMRDLELRGAGNLLGAEQSGHIAGVGFDLYCQLLKQSISRLKGDPSALRIRATVRLDFVYTGEKPTAVKSVARDSYQAIKNEEIEATQGRVLEASIPPSYLDEARLRIEVYRELAMADSIAELKEVELSLVDRYGKFPAAVKALIQISKIRALAEEKGIDSVESEGNRLKCRLAGQKKDNFIMIGTRFPRLEARNPFKKLQEILQFINRQ
ncbi:MAG: transcription-repair coupling factor [Verrucomicrobia bacterium]|nr:transcription-repair coupling factor [Verrucomicrobiota bacterium]MDA1065557.1 transcription-repair coupling factor [Verrucomicrobiota bacterium]